MSTLIGSSLIWCLFQLRFRMAFAVSGSKSKMIAILFARWAWKNASFRKTRDANIIFHVNDEMIYLVKDSLRKIIGVKNLSDIKIFDWRRRTTGTYKEPACNYINSRLLCENKILTSLAVILIEIYFYLSMCTKILIYIWI